MFTQSTVAIRFLCARSGIMSVLSCEMTSTSFRPAWASAVTRVRASPAAMLLTTSLIFVPNFEFMDCWTLATSACAGLSAQRTIWPSLFAASMIACSDGPAPEAAGLTGPGGFAWHSIRGCGGRRRRGRHGRCYRRGTSAACHQSKRQADERTGQTAETALGPEIHGGRYRTLAG